jgi:predicted DNA-binding protein (MmcQ/YjbR family)
VPKALLVKPDPSERKALEEDSRFFVPAYWAGKGWLAFDLDKPDVDWSEVVELVEDSYRQNAPKTLIAELDQRLAN